MGHSIPTLRMRKKSQVDFVDMYEKKDKDERGSRDETKKRVNN